MSKFDIKDTVDNCIYHAYNFTSDIFFNLKKNDKKILLKNKKFLGKHINQRCFILGTGPSLNNLSCSHVSKLKSEITFGVNFLYKAVVVKDLLPTYYSLCDNIFWGSSRHTFREVHDRYSLRPPVFITDIRARDVLSSYGIFDECITLYTRHYPVNRMRYDLTKNLSISMNVIGMSIQVAMYMGFREIVLLGCDYNSFCSASLLHCYDDNSECCELPKYNLAFYLKYYYLTTSFHYLIAKLAKDMDIKIYNATENSLLDSYPIIPIDHFFI